MQVRHGKNRAHHAESLAKIPQCGYKQNNDMR